MDSGGSWTGWAAVPTGSTDAAPAVEFFNGRLYVAVKGFGSNTIWLNSMDTGTFVWSGWELQPGSTPRSPSLAASSSRLYLAVRGTNNRIYWRRMDSAGSWTSWTACPTGSTDSAPAIAYFNNWLDAAVKGFGSNNIYLNSLNPTTLLWVGWSLEPGATPSSPALASSSSYLYMAVRGGDNRIYWRRITTGGSWSSWTPVPTGSTNAAPAIAFFNNRLYAAVKGNGNTGIYLNSMDPSTLLWSGWSLQPGGSSSPTALTASPTHLYQSARGMNDRIYWRRII